MADFISRDAAYQAIEAIDENAGARGSGFTDPERIMRDSAFYALDAIKPADVRPVVRGKWEWRNTDALASKAWTCSVCGRRKAFKTNFCPNCGADMREVEP